MAMDEQDRAEELDEDTIGEEYPPEQPLRVDTYGTTAAEERAGEPIVEAMAREVPDTAAGTERTDDDLVGTEGIDDDDRDLVQEREGAVPAEEAAMHVEQTGALDRQ